jgi:hypothetical protein
MVHRTGKRIPVTGFSAFHDLFSPWIIEIVGLPFLLGSRN